MFCIFGQFLWWSLDSYRFRGSGLKRESDDHLFGEVFPHFLVGLAYSFSVFIFSRTLVILDVRCYLLVFAFGDHKCDYHHCGSFWEKVTSHAKWEENIMHLWFWETNSYLMHLTYSQRLFFAEYSWSKYLCKIRYDNQVSSFRIPISRQLNIMSTSWWQVMLEKIIPKWSHILSLEKISLSSQFHYSLWIFFVAWQKSFLFLSGFFQWNSPHKKDPELQASKLNFEVA